jgi:hypothetical protein
MTSTRDRRRRACPGIMIGVLWILVLAGAPNAAAVAGERGFPGVLPRPKLYKEAGSPLLLAARGERVAIDVPTDHAALRSARASLVRALDHLGIDVGNATPSARIIIRSGPPDSELVPFATNRPRSAEFYALDVFPPADGNPVTVRMVGRSPIATYYGVQTLIQLLAHNDRGVTIRYAQVRDWPTYSFRSFKGQCWYYRDNRMMARWAPRFKWNVFGPCYTDEPDWREPSAAYRDMIAQLCDQAGEDGVIRIMQLGNPYMLKKKAIRATSDEDIATLASFFELSLGHGSDVLMLCLDDFAYLPKEDASTFDSLAAANAHIVSAFAERIWASHPGTRILLCPPPYWLRANQAKGYEWAHDYLRDLCARIPKSISIVWTGRDVTTRCHQRSDVAAYQALIGPDRGLFLWDNTLKMPPGWKNVFRANAFLADCDDIAGSAWPALADLVNGEAVINTYGPAEVYKIPLMTAADYLWNPEAYDPQDALRRALYWFDENHEVGPMVHRWVNDLHQKLYDQRVAFLEAPSADLLGEFEAALGPYQTLFDRIQAATSNTNLIAAMEPYRRRHVEALPILRTVLKAHSLISTAPDEARAALEEASRDLKQLTEELRKGDIAGQRYGCVRQTLEARNLEAIQGLLSKIP